MASGVCEDAPQEHIRLAEQSSESVLGRLIHQRKSRANGVVAHAQVTGKTGGVINSLRSYDCAVMNRSSKSHV